MHPIQPSAAAQVFRSDPASPNTARRLIRYGGVSVITAGLAQAGLALAYGVLDWPTTPAVAFSLVVSVIPAYWLNRRHVWRQSSSSRQQVAAFFSLALTGSAVTALTTHLAEHLARSVTHDHLFLTLIVNAAALLTTAVVWLLRFVAFDRYVFVDRRHRVTLRTQP